MDTQQKLSMGSIIIKYRLSLVVALIIVLFSLCILKARAQVPLDQSSKALSPVPSMILSGSVESWQQRAQAWYTSQDLKSQRRQMRDMSRPLKRPCYYCHTRNFKGYIDSTYLISLQMMAISAEQGLACKDCHIGQRALNTLGAKSLIQWRYSAKYKKDCRDCHQNQGQFKHLTPQGKESVDHLISDLQKQESVKEVSADVTKVFIEQLRKVKQEITIIPTSQKTPQSKVKTLIQPKGAAFLNIDKNTLKTTPPRSKKSLNDNKLGQKNIIPDHKETP